MDEPGFVIKKMSQVHCARGPQICDKCREMAKTESYCLLKLLKGGGKEARPVEGIVVNGEVQYFEYDIEKVFADEKEALAYSKANNVRMIDASGK
jgi:hypothetical protein